MYVVSMLFFNLLQDMKHTETRGLAYFLRQEEEIPCERDDEDDEVEVTAVVQISQHAGMEDHRPKPPPGPPPQRLNLPEPDGPDPDSFAKWVNNKKDPSAVNAVDCHIGWFL